MKLTAEVLTGLVNKGDRVLVGVSGGADSMCLLSLLIERRKEVDFRLFAIHVNHNIRDKEAMRDEEFVRKFCQENKVEFKCVHVQAKQYAESNNKTVEQAGRELRYDAFDKLLYEEKANKLFIAHHKDDQAETVIMHIARGSSIKGARGMNKQADKVYRPLLPFTREQILAYNKENGVPSVEDSTNSDINYSRNFVRLEILPRLKKLYPSVVDSLCSFANLCARDDDYIESQLPLGLLKKEKKQVRLLSEVADLNIALSSRLVKRAFEKLDVYADIEEKHINQVLELFSLKNGSQISLPQKLSAYKEYDGVVITKSGKLPSLEQQPFVLGQQTFKGFGQITAIMLEEGQDPELGDGNHYIDYHAIPPKAVWRTKKDGDIFAKLGSGSKKLSDYFTDKKVPLRLRETIPVLAVGNKILVVAGLDIADGVKLTSESEQIVKLSYKLEE